MVHQSVQSYQATTANELKAFYFNTVVFWLSTFMNIYYCFLINLFLNDLNNDIDEAGYSIFINESTDIGVTKFLGIVIIYFSLFQKKIVSTYLALVLIEECSAEALANIVRFTLKKCNLDIKKLVGVGTDLK